jgi:SAM-dependent methyltransferase
MSIFAKARRKFHSAWTDLRYGGSLLRGSVDSRFAHLGARGTENSGYDVLEQLFASQIRPKDVLVDVGCGKGRVLNWWLDHYRSHRMYGIELDPDIAAQTRNRLRRFQNVTVLAGNVCEQIPADGSLFYLFNPFDGVVMQSFINALQASPVAHNGLLRRIVYYNCKHVDLFENNRQFSVRHISLPQAHASAVIDFSGNHQAA